MSERSPIFLTEPLVWGWGTAGESLVLEATGVTVDGVPILRIVSGTPSSDAAAALVDDANGNTLVDDATGQILHDG